MVWNWKKNCWVKISFFDHDMFKSSWNKLWPHTVITCLSSLDGTMSTEELGGRSFWIIRELRESNRLKHIKDSGRRHRKVLARVQDTWPYCYLFCVKQKQFYQQNNGDNHHMWIWTHFLTHCTQLHRCLQNGLWGHKVCRSAGPLTPAHLTCSLYFLFLLSLLSSSSPSLHPLLWWSCCRFPGDAPWAYRTPHH